MAYSSIQDAWAAGELDASLLNVHTPEQLLGSAIANQRGAYDAYNPQRQARLQSAYGYLVEELGRIVASGRTQPLGSFSAQQLESLNLLSAAYTTTGVVSGPGASAMSPQVLADAFAAPGVQVSLQEAFASPTVSVSSSAAAPSGRLLLLGAAALAAFFLLRRS